MHKCYNIHYLSMKFGNGNGLHRNLMGSFLLPFDKYHSLMKMQQQVFAIYKDIKCQMSGNVSHEIHPEVD